MQQCISALRQHRSLAEDTCLDALRHCIVSLQQAADDHAQLGTVAAAREAIRVRVCSLTNAAHNVPPGLVCVS